jgi:hypothetical protein
MPFFHHSSNADFGNKLEWTCCVSCRYPAETLLSFAYLPLLATLLNSKVRNSPSQKLLMLVRAVHFLAYSALLNPPFIGTTFPRVRSSYWWPPGAWDSVQTLSSPNLAARIVARAVMAGPLWSRARHVPVAGKKRLQRNRECPYTPTWLLRAVSTGGYVLHDNVVKTVLMEGRNRHLATIATAMY